MFQVVWTYDGCPDKTMGVPVDTVQECKTVINDYVETHAVEFDDPKLSLDIVDLVSGRLISYVL